MIQRATMSLIAHCCSPVTKSVFFCSHSVLLYFVVDFKLKDFLKDDETLSHFLHHNASLPRHALKQIVEADVNLEKVR